MIRHATNQLFARISAVLIAQLRVHDLTPLATPTYLLRLSAKDLQYLSFIFAQIMRFTAIIMEHKMLVRADR